MKVTIVTAIPSPYQVELFDTLQQHEDVDLTAVYVSVREEGRQWTLPDLGHRALFIEGNQVEAKKEIACSDVVVFSNYTESIVRKWMHARAKSSLPWVFWGERPGFKMKGFLGRWYRRVRLWPLYRSNIPIWGIGGWAVEKYKKEFGAERPYSNIPYYSDVRRFTAASTPTRGHKSSKINILYSGSLIKRKGVDLLAKTFTEIAPRAPHLHLQIAGDGPLREQMERILSPVANQVTFHGFVAWDLLPDIYAGADVLCVPSRYDGWALVVPEGLAAGLPVIATDQMGAAIDLVQAGKNGWRIPANSLGALRKVMQDVKDMSPKALKEMGVRGQRTILEKHTLQDGADRILTGLRDALR